MPSTYKEKILKEIEEAPQEIVPELYRVFHRLKLELMEKSGKTRNRQSLKGIWKGCRVEETLFSEAKKSVFPYETK